MPESSQGYQERKKETEIKLDTLSISALTVAMYNY